MNMDESTEHVNGTIRYAGKQSEPIRSLSHRARDQMEDADKSQDTEKAGRADSAERRHIEPVDDGRLRPAGREGTQRPGKRLQRAPALPENSKPREFRSCVQLCKENGQPGQKARANQRIHDRQVPPSFLNPACQKKQRSVNRQEE